MILRSVAACLALAVTAPGVARAERPLWPFQSVAEARIDQARDARVRGEYRLAASLLDEAGREAGVSVARLLHEQGLLARDRGQLDAAARLLNQAANRSSSSDARVDQAGTLVQLGRWPEAVTVLRRAFDERGASLRTDAIVADRRFVKLADFEPYKELITTVREEQSGPVGRLLIRLEKVEESARVAADVLRRIAGVMTVLWRLGSALGAAAVAMILLGLVLTFGVAQLGLLRPPWTLVVGMTSAATLWHLGARVASADQSGGWQTIAIALAVVFGPWALFLGGRALWRYRRGKRGLGQPLSTDRLPHTLALVDELARLGRRRLEAAGDEAVAVDADLERARQVLVERLDS